MTKYPLTSRMLHWLMAALIIFMLALGSYMTEFLSKESVNRSEVYNLHKSFGVMVLILVLIRIINRLFKTPPALPSSISPLEKNLAHLGHFALYILMLLTPISGYLTSVSFGFPVHFFGIELPALVEKNFDHGKIFAEAHEVLSYSLLAVVIIHILAVIKHRFFDRPENDVLQRML